MSVLPVTDNAYIPPKESFLAISVDSLRSLVMKQVS